MSLSNLNSFDWQFYMAVLFSSHRDHGGSSSNNSIGLDQMHRRSKTKSSLYKEAENLFRSSGIDASLLLDSRLDAIAQATIDENPFKVCERFMGFRLKTSIINAGENADANIQYMANWKKKSAVRMADYICQHRTLELTDAQLDRPYNDIVLITKQEGVERYVDDYAIESSLFEIAEAAGVIAFKRKQNGTCQILD